MGRRKNPTGGQGLKYYGYVGGVVADFPVAQIVEQLCCWNGQ